MREDMLLNCVPNIVLLSSQNWISEMSGVFSYGFVFKNYIQTDDPRFTIRDDFFRTQSKNIFFLIWNEK